MKRILLKAMACLLASGLPAIPSTARAQQIEVQGVWDLTSSYELELIDGVEFTLDIAQDSKGKVTGSGSFLIDIEGVQLDFLIDIKGKVKTAGDGITYVTLTLKYSGQASYLGETFKFKASQKVAAEIDPVSGSMVGNIDTAVSLAGFSEKSSDFFEMDLDPDMDGAGTIVFNSEQDEKGRITGSATFTLSNGDELPFLIKGKINTKKGVQTFSLKGDKLAGNKGSIKLTLSIDGEEVLSFKGKLLGQKLGLDSVVP